MKTKFLILMTGILVFLSVSCKKLINVDQPRNTLTSEKIFSNDATASAALNGLYIQLMSAGLNFSNSLITITGGLSADEFKVGTSTVVLDEFVNNSLSASNAYVSSLWSGPYLRIYQCNAIIEGAQNSPSISAALRESLIATAKFNRAFIYFNLVQLYGDVPLVLSTDYTQTAKLGRTPEAQVYGQIVKDLTEAQGGLGDDVATNRTIVSKFAAKALLARVYLYQKDWTNAALLSNEILVSNKFKLVADLKQVFIANSTEAIWQLSPTDGTGYTWEGNYFVGKANVIPTYPMQPSLFNSFEPNDNRKRDWIGSQVVGSTTYYYPYKYRISTGTGTPTEFYMVLRFAEQYLIHAEAMANQGKLTEAMSDLDKLRARAGLPLYANDGLTHTQTEIILMIENERRHELFCEWAHRWFDLKRTGRSLAVLQPLKANLKQSALLLPVPFSQLQTNLSLTQNPGYQN